MFPIYPNDDEENLPPYCRETTWIEQLKEFHSQFDSSIRAILRDCLFREIEEDGQITFQILCPNEVILKRLIQKRQKIANRVRWIWEPKVDRLVICIEKNGLECRAYSLKKYLID
ncbi:hypothetical protein H6F77_23535 [Microcoleus sp. FACHB-831]|uniref:hypothetical protein n=1 Tax=Microcoleus sp. FACHB-831 TaxID=2692827 RepID=UPI001687FAB6|nr:hypothetical protein [Microcoleus sp. FACHB-831]MBD1924018.1 hypothetical protein [Microcoleus sp. FACHB-831]